jgi:N-acetylmuramoyl-L-alanine amidase
MKMRLAGLSFVLAMSLLISARAIAAITSANVHRDGVVTELSFMLDSPAPRLRLSAHGNEISIDLDHTAARMPSLPRLDRTAAPIRMLHVSSPAGGAYTHIVVGIAGKADYAIVQRQREIVLRLAPPGTVANLKAPPPKYREQMPASSNVAEIPHAQPVAIHPPSPESATAVINPPIGNPLVMIDPGHGGYDPGTQSSNGILEKDVALSISRRLYYALKARGIRAQMTRDSDEFIPLSERTRRANVADADLFVSIHLNSSPSVETTGIETYYLNNTTDRATIRLARMENAGVTGTSAPADSNLNYILADLRQSYKASEAASLARMIESQTVTDLDSQLGIDETPLGAKMGPFYVLVGAHMPAVLVECGFLSNYSEAQRLASAQYQDTLAAAIATAVARYLNSDATAGNL